MEFSAAPTSLAVVIFLKEMELVKKKIPKFSCPFYKNQEASSV